MTVEIIIGILISLSSNIFIIYASIAMGHLFNKHKILASFGAFIVLNILTQIFFILISLITGIADFSNINISSNNIAGTQSVFQLVFVYGIIFTGLLSAAYFAVTNLILNKLLNTILIFNTLTF